MKSRPILVDQTLRELTEHGTEDFPMSMDEQIVSDDPCASVAHWHEEVQIVVVTAGSVLFRTPAGDFPLREGDGLFLNSACLHEAVLTEGARSVYICVNFHPRLISGYSGSILRRDYVDPVLSCPQMQAIPLYEEPWHREVCRLMHELKDAYNAQEYGYEISLKIILYQIWRQILTHNRHFIAPGAPIAFSDRQRMKKMQLFIQKNYMRRISLTDIANAGHISRGECCRMFRRVTQTTPFLYLVGYRVAQSVKLLFTTSLNITEIAMQTGFGNSSYYTECFKKDMRCTPTEYRKQLRRGTPEAQIETAAHSQK